MSGVFDWLDNVTTKVASVAGRAVDVAGQIAQANAAVQATRTQAEAAKVQPASVAQATTAAGAAAVPMWVWVAGAGLLAVGAMLMLRRR